MSVEKAKANYLGTEGHERLNCAQSVAEACGSKFDLTQERFASLHMCGGGRAPQGKCGALHAAQVLLEKKFPDRISSCEDIFLREAGSIYCREIRAFKKLSCIGCVEKAAGLLEAL